MPQIEPPPVDPMSKGDIILEALRRAGSEGVSNTDLAKDNLGYRGRITELRKQGHDIYCRRQAVGEYQYYLRDEGDDYEPDRNNIHEEEKS